MSTTTTSILATPPSQCGATLYDIPTSDAACAMPFGGNHTEVMAKCCEQVVSYQDDCGLYCLAQGQSVQELTDCLFNEGAAYQNVFCNAPTNATATATGNTEPTASGASIVASNGASTTDDSDPDSDNNSDDGDGGSAAVSVRGANAVGLMIGALLFSSAFLGFAQI
jgi:hypothetical protein